MHATPKSACAITLAVDLVKDVFESVPGTSKPITLPAECGRLNVCGFVPANSIMARVPD